MVKTINVFRHTKKSSSQKKGQSSVEYIFVVALALLLIIPGTIIFFQYSQNSQKAIVSSQIYKIGNDLVGTGELMYSVGENSWQTIEINFPSSVQSVMVYEHSGGGGEMVIRHGTDYPSDAVFFTHNALLNSTQDDCTNGCFIPINKGYTKVRIESQSEGEIIYRVLS
ncbi:MAG: hypothetical protein ACOCQQ_01840 [Candidatus Nanoarchaeia archaeon]